MKSEFDCTVQDRHRRDIDPELDEDALILSAKHNGKLIGEMHFDTIDHQRHHDLKLVWMFLDQGGPGYTGCGIGRKMIELMNEFHSGPLVAGRDEGTTDDDGSHLTGSGAGFVTRMQSLGLIR